MKATLIRLGIRGFNPKLKKAAGRLEDLRTPEDEPIPPNTMAELRRDMDRRRLVSDQIRQIEEARLDRLKQAVFVLGCRLGDDLFLVVDDLDRLLEQAIGAQLDGDVVLALELGAIGAPAVDRAARGHARLAGDLVQRLAGRDALAHQVSDSARNRKPRPT